MQFCWCTVHVRDMEASLKFYQEIVGLRLTRRFNEIPGTDLAFLGDDQTQIELIVGKGEAYSGGGVSLGFMVDNLEEKMAFVQQRGITVHSGPFAPSPRTRFFFVQDPDGLLVQFVEQKESAS